MTVLASTAKELKILLRDRGTLIRLFLLPLMFITVMSLALGKMYRRPGEGMLKLPVVVEDTSASADDLVRALAAVKGGLEIETVPAAGRAGALELVKHGKRVAALVVPAGFGDALAQASPTTVTLFTDPGQALATTTVMAAVRGALARTQGEAMRTRGIDALLYPIEQAVAQLPPAERAQVDLKGLRAVALKRSRQATEQPLVDLRTESVGAARARPPGVYEQNVPGYAVMFMFFIVSHVAGSVMTEKRNGTLRRLTMAPVSKAELLLGKIVPNFAVGLIQAAVLFTIGHFVFGMELGGDIPGLVLISAAVAAAATGLGILVAALATTDEQVSGLSTLLIVTLAALGGSMVPLFVMPDFMQAVARLTPHAWALLGYQKLLVGGGTLRDVLPNVGVLAAFASACFATAVWRFRFE
jgi:ABC-2 type transport system permease protein